MANLRDYVRVWATPFMDLRRIFSIPGGFARYIKDLSRFRRMPGGEGLRLSDAVPSLWDRTSGTGIDAHYIYMNAWASREIRRASPRVHVDVGSQVGFVTTLSAFIPLQFVDIRPLAVSLSGLESMEGSILSLPFRDGELPSVSSLHVIEHIGLGRYGDPLDPRGDRKAVRELARVVARGGRLYIGVPVGRRRLCFNAHRVYAPGDLVRWFAEEGLHLREFSAVDDNGHFRCRVLPEDFASQEYACGMFYFARALEEESSGERGK